MSVNPTISTDATDATVATTVAITGQDFFNLRVAKKEAVAQGIYLFELRHPDGAPLPTFTAGSHLTVLVPSGVRRNYSLCSDPADTGMYQIAVKRDDAGRGGSISMADDVQVDQWLSVSAPRNNFELAERASDFVFVAGGIGITPILSMMRHLKSIGRARFKLYYCTRDAASTAFIDNIHCEFSGQIQIHHDNGDSEQAFDFWPVFESPTKAHVYCCGPRGLMDAVADMSGHWSPSAIHFESFGSDTTTYAANTPFTVRLHKNGEVIAVSAEQSILEALRASGHHVTSSCESGTCGSCRTGLLSGEVEHRDMVLSDDEKASNIMLCVSRSRSREPSAELVLDL